MRREAISSAMCLGMPNSCRPSHHPTPSARTHVSEPPLLQVHAVLNTLESCYQPHLDCACRPRHGKSNARRWLYSLPTKWMDHHQHQLRQYVQSNGAPASGFCPRRCRPRRMLGRRSRTCRARLRLQHASRVRSLVPSPAAGGGLYQSGVATRGVPQNRLLPLSGLPQPGMVSCVCGGGGGGVGGVGGGGG